MTKWRKIGVWPWLPTIEMRKDLDLFLLQHTVRNFVDDCVFPIKERIRRE